MNLAVPRPTPILSAAALRRLVAVGVLLASAISLSAPALAADLARGEEIVMGKCFVCHGATGESSSPMFPRLSGQHAAYIVRQLADYKSGRRKSTTMQPMVGDLSDSDFQALGAFFEAQLPQAHGVDDPELAQVGRFVYQRGNPYSGVAACAACHGATGGGTAQLPRLAGQHAQYTESQLRQFNKRERTNDNSVMHTIASKLTELEIKAVASFVSGLK
jgi:cytochrome c553